MPETKQKSRGRKTPSVSLSAATFLREEGYSKFSSAGSMLLVYTTNDAIANCELRIANYELINSIAFAAATVPSLTAVVSWRISFFLQSPQT